MFFLCSLPLLSHPVFERTAAFLFGRIQIGKYQTNISLVNDLNFGKVKRSNFKKIFSPLISL